MPMLVGSAFVTFTIFMLPWCSLQSPLGFPVAFPFCSFDVRRHQRLCTSAYGKKNPQLFFLRSHIPLKFSNVRFPRRSPTQTHAPPRRATTATSTPRTTTRTRTHTRTHTHTHTSARTYAVSAHLFRAIIKLAFFCRPKVAAVACRARGALAAFARTFADRALHDVGCHLDAVGAVVVLCRQPLFAADG